MRQGALAAGIVLVLGGSLGAWLLAGAVSQPVAPVLREAAGVPFAGAGRPAVRCPPVLA